MLQYRQFRLTSPVLTKRRQFWLLALPADVGTSGRPNKKICSDLTFWILIRTVSNSWETWKITLERFPTGIRPTPLYIWEDHGRLSSYLSNQHKNTINQSTISFYPLFPSTSSPRSSSVLHAWRIDDDDALESRAVRSARAAHSRHTPRRSPSRTCGVLGLKRPRWRAKKSTSSTCPRYRGTAPTG
jgi:hypothetical protein